jgi:copper chaperone CopZ
MKKLILVVLISFLGIAVQAQEKNVKKSKNSKIEFKVEGNCEMCKKRIETSAFSVKGVKSVDWHIEHKDIHLTLDENKCTKEDVAKAIAKVGHDTEYIKATDEDYDKLHGCCLYERMK